MDTVPYTKTSSFFVENTIHDDVLRILGNHGFLVTGECTFGPVVSLICYAHLDGFYDATFESPEPLVTRHLRRGLGAFWWRPEQAEGTSHYLLTRPLK